MLLAWLKEVGEKGKVLAFACSDSLPTEVINEPFSAAGESEKRLCY
jgi:hypothetical protein